MVAQGQASDLSNLHAFHTRANWVKGTTLTVRLVDCGWMLAGRERAACDP